MNNQIHIPLPDKFIHPFPHVVQIRRMRRDNMDNTHDFLPPTHKSRRVIMTVSMSSVCMINCRVLAIIDPEPGDGVANHPAQFAEFLERVFDGVFQVVWNDEQEFTTRGRDEWDGGREDEDGDYDGC